MSVSEFEMIRRYFSDAGAPRDDVALDVGDDCALLEPPPGRQLAVTTDTLVEGRHFVAGADPCAIGHKALAVNLSDLAAMGAAPAWVTLALTLPRFDEDWLEAFMAGFDALARHHGVRLVGGDTTRGPLTITVQALGSVAPGEALRRGGGRPGDRLCVSGALGDAGVALERLREAGGERTLVDADLLARLDRPNPRVALGLLLAGRAACAIDVSDGLSADLGHLCAASGVGAWLDLARVPLSPAVAGHVRDGDWRPVLTGGDDYELLFAVAPQRLADLAERCAAAGCPLHEIGRLEATAGIRVRYPGGHERPIEPRGFDHFAGD